MGGEAEGDAVVRDGNVGVMALCLDWADEAVDEGDGLWEARKSVRAAERLAVTDPSRKRTERHFYFSGSEKHGRK